MQFAPAFLSVQCSSHLLQPPKFKNAISQFLTRSQTKKFNFPWLHPALTSTISSLSPNGSFSSSPSVSSPPSPSPSASSTSSMSPSSAPPNPSDAATAHGPSSPDPPTASASPSPSSSPARASTSSSSAATPPSSSPSPTRSESPKSEIKAVVIDFSGDLAAGVEALRSTIRDLDVGILVNNAGVSYPYARFFHEVDDELMRNVIKVNVEGVTRVTHAVIPGMVERKRGAIVNIGSSAAIVIPSDPLYAVYAATKAYVDQFSRCLYVEYKNKGIDVQCQVPVYVATKMASIRRSSFFVPSSDTYARAAVRWIGYEPRCTPYWPHSILWRLVSMLPESAVDNWRLGFCLNIRKKGQLKDAKKNNFATMPTKLDINNASKESDMWSPQVANMGSGPHCHSLTGISC